MASRGNMREIRERADTLSAREPHYRSFAGKLRLLAEGCQSRAILTLVKDALAEKSFAP